jgi:hypothetical protein
MCHYVLHLLYFYIFNKVFLNLPIFSIPVCLSVCLSACLCNQLVYIYDSNWSQYHKMAYILYLTFWGKLRPYQSNTNRCNHLEKKTKFALNLSLRFALNLSLKFALNLSFKFAPDWIRGNNDWSSMQWGKNHAIHEQNIMTYCYDKMYILKLYRYKVFLNRLCIIYSCTLV